MNAGSAEPQRHQVDTASSTARRPVVAGRADAMPDVVRPAPPPLDHRALVDETAPAASSLHCHVCHSHHNRPAVPPPRPAAAAARY